MANGHGGWRPGAGRKSSQTQTYQASRRTQLQQIVTDEDWAEVVKKAVEQAKSGDYVARAWLSPYVAGKPPEEIHLAGAEGDPLEIVIRRE